MEEALVEQGVETTEPTAHYLVALLTDFAHPDKLASESMDRPLPFLLDEALSAMGHERFERLRSLGDTVLYTTGFFSDHLEVRGVAFSYVSAVGARAYDGAASMLGRASQPEATAPTLFRELAENFERFARVLSTLAEGLMVTSAQGSDRAVLRLYERWLRSGSSHLAAALAARGVAPVRGTGELH